MCRGHLVVSDFIGIKGASDLSVSHLPSVCVFWDFLTLGYQMDVVSPVFKVGQLPTHVTPIDPILAAFLVFIID